MTAPISNGPTTHGYTTMRDATFQIQAPHGLFFTIPANHMMYYAPADPANISKQLWDLAIFGRVPVLTTTKQRPEAVVSRDIFYYSPEGTYEPITQGDNPAIQELFTNQDIDAETVRTCVDQYLSPSPAFRARFDLP